MIWDWFLRPEVAWCFETKFDFEIFDTVLPDCHGVVNGEMMDHKWETINLRRVFLVLHIASFFGCDR